MERKISIFDRKPREILNYMYKNNIIGGETGRSEYISMIYKHTNCTYIWLLKIIEYFENVGIIKSIRVGRVKYVKLTELGLNIARTFDEISKSVNEAGQNI